MEKNIMDKILSENCIDEIEKSVAEILTNFYQLTQKDEIKKISQTTCIFTCLTLVIKNLEINLLNNEIDISFDEIIEQIKLIDYNFKKFCEKQKE